MAPKTSFREMTACVSTMTQFQKSVIASLLVVVRLASFPALFLRAKVAVQSGSRSNLFFMHSGTWWHSFFCKQPFSSAISVSSSKICPWLVLAIVIVLLLLLQSLSCHFCLTDIYYQRLLFPPAIILAPIVFLYMNHISDDFFSHWLSFWRWLLLVMTH